MTFLENYMGSLGKVLAPKVTHVFNQRLCLELWKDLKSRSFTSIEEALAPFQTQDYRDSLASFATEAREFSREQVVRIGEIFLTDEEGQSCEELGSETIVAMRLRERFPLLTEDVFWALWSTQFGFGPVGGFLTLPHLNEVSVFDNHKCFIEVHGKTSFVDLSEVKGWNCANFLARLIERTEVELNDSTLWCDGMLCNRIRMHIIMPPLLKNGPSFSFRKLLDRSSGEMNWSNSDERALSVMRQYVIEKCNILVVGPTGSGKTTLLGKLMGWVPSDERIVTIEDTLEIDSSHPHVVSLLSRINFNRSVLPVSLRDLVRQTLRMSADRLVLGECRGDEAFDILQALSTGHKGSMASIHGSSCLAALSRLALLCQFSGVRAENFAWQEWLCDSVDVVVLLGKGNNKGRIFEICVLKEWQKGVGFDLRTIWNIKNED